MRMSILSGVIAALAGTSVASANVVVDWNNAMLNAIKSTSMNPPAASRAMAMVSTAVFDAVNSVNPQYTPYRVLGAAPMGTNAEAAAITAAHNVLSSLFPSQQASFDSLRDAQFASIPNDAGKMTGMALGQFCATDMINWRTGDGSTASVPYNQPANPGIWRPTLPANAPALLPGWGDVTPFGLTTGDQFRPAAPSAMNTAAYAQQLREVQVLGAADAEVSDRDNNGLPDRTPDQSNIARFWAQGGGTSTPPGQWNKITQVVANDRGLNLLDTARAFALLNIATADAGIAAWDSKYEFNTWRPITAIREADTDGNAATDPETGWSPLLATPPFPSFVSGHSTFSSASAAILAALFGDDTAFTVSSDAPGLDPRSFTSFSAAAEEAGFSRILGGIHYTDDNIAGLLTGHSIGSWAYEHYLQPIPAPGAVMLAGMAGLAAVRRKRA